MDEINLEQLRLTPEGQAAIGKSHSAKRKRERGRPIGRFVRGPIPEWWITTAASLPGKSLHVALAIWSVHHCSRDHVVRLTRALLTRFHVTPDSAYRALRHLERARLLVADRRRGRLATVRLLLHSQASDTSSPSAPVMQFNCMSEAGL